MPKTNHVSVVYTYNHKDILWLQFMMDRKWNAISREKHFELILFFMFCWPCISV